MKESKSREPRHRKHKPASGRLSRFVTATIVTLGVLIMSYPSAASWIDQFNQTKLVDSYKEVVDTLAVQQRSQSLNEAREYNEDLQAGTAYDPYSNAAEAPDTEQFDRYMSLLEGVPTGVMARLRIPAIEVDLPIYHGTSDKTLKLGVGHLYGTALPVGGKGMHPVLTAHSGLADAVMFTNLHKVKPGDLFQVETYGEKITYKVTETNVILPEETELLRADPDRDLISLVTCTPVTINTHRLVVTGERIPNPIEPSDEMPTQDLPGFPWWIVWVSATIIGSVVYVLWGGRERKRPIPDEPKAVDAAQ
ncbi:class C sortase [Actinomycetaceae bacterium MB13-C1-2]|nr:class C sortase [Actinomycetaceae bacterium MB13-C1-2]